MLRAMKPHHWIMAAVATVVIVALLSLAIGSRLHAGHQRFAGSVSFSGERLRR
jgi:4-hydroxybenzoate polyprenyltransferase